MADFYNLNELKNISIVTVAEMLNCEMKKSGSDYFCKVRDEEIPSCKLYTKTNTYYDFGNAESGGDVINFVAYVQNISNAQAINLLAQAFNLEPIKKDYKNNLMLSEQELNYIGITNEEFCNFNNKYLKLQEEHKNRYKNLIKEKAIPFVKELQQYYYYECYTTDILASESDINILDLEMVSNLNDFANQVSYSEYLLEKVIEPIKNEINFKAKIRDYKEDIINIRKGLIDIEVGNITYKDLKATNEELCYKKISLKEFLNNIDKTPKQTLYILLLLKKNIVNVCFNKEDIYIFNNLLEKEIKNIDNNIPYKSL